jgi:hypothetical protein
LISCERPQDIESCAASDDEEWEHAFAGFGGGFEEVDAEREQEGEESLGVEHEGSAHVVCDFGGEDAIKAEPDEAFDELMNGEKRRERGEEEFAAVLHSGECGDADAGEDCAAGEIGGC